MLSEYSNYPDHVLAEMLMIRGWIFQLEQEYDLPPIQETLKWQQISFLCKTGSTIRIDWQPEQPKKISIFCHCQTSLIDTFKQLYPQEFEFKGNRQLIVDLDVEKHAAPLKHCLSLALRYHKLKHLPLLGN